MKSSVTEDEVFLFFKNLNYKVDWDYKGNEAWFEIYKDEKILLVVDMKIPLEEIKEDLAFISDSAEKTFKLLNKYDLAPSDFKKESVKELLNSIKKNISDSK